jgi:hypothetical protein
MQHGPAFILPAAMNKLYINHMRPTFAGMVQGALFFWLGLQFGGGSMALLSV